MLRMCVCTHSRFIENDTIWILEDRPLISEVVLSQNGIRARSGLNTHSKHLKITTTFTVRTISPYKDYSSLLRWQANICVYIATTELHRRRYVVDFDSVQFIFLLTNLFCCLWL
jgi:hypothetical protein